MIEHDNMLINPNNIKYCQLVERDGYGSSVDHIYILFIDGRSIELNEGQELWKKLKELN